MRVLRQAFFVLSAAAAIVAGVPIPASASPNQPERVAEQVVHARQKAMQEAATAADVDAFLSFGTENMVYEDPVVKMRIEGKNQIRQGMLAFLGVTRAARIVVTKKIARANVVVFEQNVSFEEKQDDGRWTPRTRSQVTVFEFEGSQVRRIADYWSR
ncbi:MAG: nuclear transport factor 2 family protein [Acidobacteriota bacterium]